MDNKPSKLEVKLQLLGLEYSNLNAWGLRIINKTSTDENTYALGNAELGVMTTTLYKSFLANRHFVIGFRDDESEGCIDIYVKDKEKPVWVLSLNSYLLTDVPLIGDTDKGPEVLMVECTRRSHVTHRYIHRIIENTGRFIEVASDKRLTFGVPKDNSIPLLTKLDTAGLVIKDGDTFKVINAPELIFVNRR